MDYIRCPAELLDSFEDSTCKEDRSFSIVLEEVAISISIHALAVEVILVIDEIYLHAGCRD